MKTSGDSQWKKIAVRAGVVIRALMGAWVVAVMGAALGLTSGLASAQSPNSGATIARQFIVSAAPGQTVDVARLNGLGGTVLSAANGRGELLVRNDGGLTDAQFAAAVPGQGGVAACEPHRRLSTAEGQTQSFFFSITEIQYDTQVGIGQTNALAGQAVTRGASVVVAVLDTGVAPSPLFGGRLLPGFNFVTGTTDTTDAAMNVDTNGTPGVDQKRGHGTMVAGIIRLVAPEASILPVTVLDSDGMGDAWTIMQGIDYAVARGADIINLSLASPEAMSDVDDAIGAAEAAGVTVVVSTGNGGASGVGQARDMYPARYGLAVGGVDSGDARVGFSDYGRYVDLWAPADDSLSMYPGGVFAGGDGTSFACAWVSGAAALVKAKKPNADATAVAEILKLTGDSVVTNLAGCDNCREERLNIGRAVASACPADLAGGEDPGQPPEPDLAVTIDDLLLYLDYYGAGLAGADIDDGSGTGELDGGITVDDLLYYLERYQAGC